MSVLLVCLYVHKMRMPCSYDTSANLLFVWGQSCRACVKTVCVLTEVVLLSEDRLVNNHFLANNCSDRSEKYVHQLSICVSGPRHAHGGLLVLLSVSAHIYASASWHAVMTRPFCRVFAWGGHAMLL